jgi:hypothetical protein
MLCCAVQSLALPAADAARETWINGFGFDHMSEEQQAMVKKELRMLIFPGTQLLVKPLPQRAGAEGAPLNPGAAATADPGVLEASQAACEAAAKVAAEAAAAEGIVPAAAAAAGGVPGQQLLQQQHQQQPGVHIAVLGGNATAQQQDAMQQQLLEQQQVLLAVQQQMPGLQLQGPLLPVNLNSMVAASEAYGNGAGTAAAAAAAQSGALTLQPIAMSMALPAGPLALLPAAAAAGCADAGALRGSSPAAMLPVQLPLQDGFDPAVLLHQPSADAAAQPGDVVLPQQLPQQQPSVDAGAPPGILVLPQQPLVELLMSEQPQPPQQELAHSVVKPDDLAVAEVKQEAAAGGSSPQACDLGPAVAAPDPAISGAQEQQEQLLPQAWAEPKSAQEQQQEQLPPQAEVALKQEQLPVQLCCAQEQPAGDVSTAAAEVPVLPLQQEVAEPVLCADSAKHEGDEQQANGLHPVPAA